MRATRGPADPALTLASAATAAPAGLLLVLLAAAAVRLRRRAPAGARTTRFTIVVPAHDEEAMIAPTVAALVAQDYPTDRMRVVVVADNCRDATAAAARAAGAEVLERDEPDARGKGQAIAWALERLDVEDAMVLVDADCLASPNLLTAMDAHLCAGADAVQADYVVANPEASSAAALRFAAFALINTVRPAGRDALGASCGLVGSGMAFSRATLERVPWRSFGVGEDAEQHARLVQAGLRVRFAPEASVASPMPLTLSAGTDQQLRWEATKTQFVRVWTPRLLRRAVTARDPRALHLALESLIPPQSLLLASNAGMLVLCAVLRAPRAAGLAAAGLAAQSIGVLGGLLVVRAPAAVYRALLAAPLLAARKLGAYARLLTGRGPSSWVRTERDPAASSVSTTPR